MATLITVQINFTAKKLKLKKEITSIRNENGDITLVDSTNIKRIIIKYYEELLLIEVTNYLKLRNSLQTGTTKSHSRINR